MPEDKHIPVAHVELGREEIEAANKVLRSGNLVQGDKVREFEEAFAEKVGAEQAVACSSGTAALFLAYLVMLKPGDKVLVPTFTHISTASMVIMAHGIPVLCDIDPDTLLLDTDSCPCVVDAVAPVHLFGNALPPENTCGISGGKTIARIWDACQAHRTTLFNNDIGMFFSMSCYSFYPTKNMTTMEGGMVVTSDVIKAAEMRWLRSHYQTQKYYHPHLGWNLRMTEVAAAIGIEQLKKLDSFIEARWNNASYIRERLPHIKFQKITDGCLSSYHQLVILVEDRIAVMDKLSDAGIGTAIHYPRCLHQQPALANYNTNSYPNAEWAAEHILSIPVGPWLKIDDLDRIVSALENIKEGDNNVGRVV